MGLVHPDEQEHEGVGDEGGVLPEHLDGLLSAGGDGVDPGEVAHHKAGVMVASTPEKLK